MSRNSVHLLLRGAGGFGSDADHNDPRTPEQRARRIRLWLQDVAWVRLPLAAIINVMLMSLLLSLATVPPGVAAVTLLGLAGALALVPLAAPRAGAGLRGPLMATEAVASAAGIALATASQAWPWPLIAAIALLLSPCARQGAPAWIHLLVLGPVAVNQCTGAGPLATGAMVLLCLICGAQTLRQDREARQRGLQAMEMLELEALCARLAQGFEDGNATTAQAGSQGAP